MSAFEDDRAFAASLWESLCSVREVTGHAWDLAPVLEAYSGPGRHYHNLRHIRQCRMELTRLRAVADDSAAVDAAVLFHDCVYAPTRHDNEERSADVADGLLRPIGFPQPFLDNVRQIILATRHTAPPPSPDAALVMDADLSILGKSPDEFDDYERAIRLEYAHVSDEAFAAGRARVLRQFLDRRAIYHTLVFGAEYEARARENLGRSLARLRRRRL
jgi:predicted metal-dependent HD superfamily phosphohydrolase